jgi:hypothetical protein
MLSWMITITESSLIARPQQQSWSTNGSLCSQSYEKRSFLFCGEQIEVVSRFPSLTAAAIMTQRI